MAIFEESNAHKIVLDDTLPLLCNFESIQNLEDHTVSGINMNMVNMYIKAITKRPLLAILTFLGIHHQS